MTCRSRFNTCLSVLGMRCSTLGKINFTLPLSTPKISRRRVLSQPQSKGLSIATDSLNGKFQGYSFRQNPCQQETFLQLIDAKNLIECVIWTDKLLHKANISPNLRHSKRDGPEGKSQSQ